MLDFIKNMFMDEKGVKWGSIIGMAAGAFLLPMIPFVGGLGIIGNILGAAVGLLGGNLVSGLISGGGAPETPQAPPVRGPSENSEAPRAPFTPRVPAMAMGAAR
jgi:hypothetical protein